jgi:hypothetical protein
VAYHKSIPLIRHDVMSWEPIADQAAARAVPLVKAARRPTAPTGRRTRKPVVVLGQPS